ncbi:MAG: hypothetical protein MRY74_03260, partial [Neomegalonema sp.]|nr:hypothetical protein [Neomegalonema sp.]
MDREQLERELGKLPREAIIAFAARAGLRVVPWAARYDANRNRPLLATLRANLTSAVAGEYPTVEVKRAADAAAYAGSSAVAVAAYAADAADAAAEQDLAALRGERRQLGLLRSDRVAPLELLATPLWPGGTPDWVASYWGDARQDWLDLDEGFELWVDWYEDRLEGAPWDWELM